MSRFEGEGESLGRAACIVRDRVRASEAFELARKLVFERALDRCAFKGVAELRELGGFSAVILDEIARLPESADDPSMGSQLFPYTVRSVLDLEVPALREEVQRGCSIALETARSAQGLMRVVGSGS